jgi:hypothetical protein
LALKLVHGCRGQPAADEEFKLVMAIAAKPSRPSIQGRFFAGMRRRFAACRHR